MTNDFSYMVHLGIISAALLLGTLLRNKVKFLQRFLIPASIIGGIFLLVFYNYLAPSIGLDNAFLGDLVYHLLNISFIATTLRIPVKEKKKKNLGVRQSVVAMTAAYGFQTFFGLLVAIILMKTFIPGLFPAIGYTITLGFELGPGQAYSMSKPWESLGFSGASSIGLAMAAIGFIVGSFGGVILINIGIAKGWISKEQAEKIRKNGTRGAFAQDKSETGAKLTTNSDAIESFAYHFGIVFFTYLLSYLLLWGITLLLRLAGDLGNQLAESLWGINFVFSSICATFVRKFMIAVKIDDSIDNSTLNRINGFAVDLTVCSCLGAISLVAISGYWLAIIILVLVGILLTCFLQPWYCSRLYSDYKFERFLVTFGASTGTLPTGLSLLRVVDPNFETPAAQDYVYGCGLMLPIAIPIMLSINLPANSVAQGNPSLLWIALAIGAAYVVAFAIMYRISAKKRAFASPKTFFYTGD